MWLVHFDFPDGQCDVSPNEVVRNTKSVRLVFYRPGERLMKKISPILQWKSQYHYAVQMPGMNPKEYWAQVTLVEGGEERYQLRDVRPGYLSWGNGELPKIALGLKFKLCE